MLNQVKGGEEKKGRKKLEMKAIERKGGICRIKEIRGGRKGIVAIRVSMVARDFQKCYGKWKPEGAVPLKQKASWF